MGKFRIVALLSREGTACAETALIGNEDTPEMRANIEAHLITGPNRPIPGTWTDCSENEALWPDEEDEEHYRPKLTE